jgi:maltose O-acetyltransferase
MTDLIVSIVAWLLRKVDAVRVRILKGSLRHCGERVSVRMPVVIEGPEAVVLEDDVSIASFVHIWGAGGVRVGARTMVGAHAAITSLTHDPDAPDMSRSLVRARVHIGADVWIGSGAVIHPGVTIGDGAVVGSGAVVLEDVPAGAVVVGVPARVTRMKGSMAGPRA